MGYDVLTADPPITAESMEVLDRVLLFNAGVEAA